MNVNLNQMSRDREFSDLDLFAERVQLRFNGRTHFKTSFGALLSVCFMVNLLFCISVMIKSLLTGQYINAASTTAEMQLTADGLLKNITLSDTEMRFGFKPSNTLFSATNDNDFVSFDETIGRFELLHVVRNEVSAAPTTQRIPIDLCSDGKAYCWANTDDIEIFGDLSTSTFSVVVLSLKECY
jgi:hypothetical protein